MFLKKLFRQILISLVLTLGLLTGVNLVFAQAWQEPGAVPPGGNVPGVIWNSQASGVQQNASFFVSGTGRIGQGGAFGGFTPDAVWMVSSPNAYFGNGVAGTMIGAGAGQAAGDISTDGVLKANRVRARAGTAALPGVSFSAEPDDGMYITDESGGYHNLGFVVGGAPILLMDTGYVTVNGFGVLGSGWSLPLTLRGYTTTNNNTSVGVKLQNAGGEFSAAGAKSVSFANGATEEAYLGSGAANPRLVVLGRAGQTGNLLEARNSGSAVIMSVAADGKISVGAGLAPNSSALDMSAMNSSKIEFGSHAGTVPSAQDGWAMRIWGAGTYDGADYGLGLNAGEVWTNAGPGGVVGFRVNSSQIANVAASGFMPGANNAYDLGVSGTAWRNIVAAGDVTGARLCIGADCRNAWPGAGGGGDMTGVSAGTGITGGGLSGDVTVSLDTTYTDGRYVNVPGDTMTGSLVISGAGNDLTVADSGAFGGNAPDATWKVSSPNAYFGNGVAGTIIGAGGGQAAGAITTDGNVKIGNDLMVNTADSGVNPGMPWIRSSGAYLVVNSNTGALYLNQDVAQPIYLAQQQDVIAANGNMGLGTTNAVRRLTLGGTTPQIDLGVGTGYNDAGSPGIFWYSDNVNYGIYKTAGGWNAPNYQQLQLAWNTGIVIDGGSAYGRSGTVLQPSGGNVGIGKYPTTKLDVAGNILSSGDVTGTRLCIGADCRNAWPAGGGGGDMTGVSAGTGITGGGLSGDVTVSLDTTYTDGRYVNVPGDTMTGDLTLSGAGTDIAVGGGGAFGGYTPDPNWRVTAPNGYFGDGGANQVLIGLGGNGFGNAGGINASGKITTSNDLYVGGGNIDVYPAIAGQNSVLGFNGNGTLSWVPAGNTFEFNSSVAFRGGLATTIGQTATFSGPVAVNGGYNLVVQGQVLGNTCALPGSTCTSGAPYTNANTISATNFCIGADCRNAWPAGGGGGDMTGVSAGTGLTGGGLSGDVILSLDAAHNDGSAFDSRFVNTAGDTMTGLLTAAGAGISLGGVTRTTWPADGDITGVTAGSGLSGGGLTGGVTLTWSGNALTANSGLKGNGTAAIPLEIGAGDRINVIGDHVDFGGVAKAAASGLGGNGTSVSPLAVGAGTGIIVGASTISVDDNRYVNEAGDSISGSITLTTGNVVASDGYICANSAAVASNCGTAPGTVYGDFAYVQFDVAELILSGQNLEPGEVVVIDPEVDEQVMRSYKTNDTAVAGVVSTDPGILGGHTLKAKAGTQTVELTLAGRIPVKVTDEGGPIKRGDLLTTSNTPGYAMKCADRAACVGAIVGKAMGELKSGKGTIIVLMSLQ